MRSRRAVNAGYRFQVAQVRGGGQQWQIVSCRKAEGSADFNTFESHERDYLWAMESGYRIVGIHLNTFLTDKDFKITAVQYIPGEKKDERRVRLEADYLGPKGSYRRAGTSYWIELNPENFWLIDRGGLKYRGQKREERQEVSYRATASGLPFPSTMKYDQRDPAGGWSFDRLYQFKTPTKCRLEDDEFYLTYYGIPESVLETTSTRPAFRLFALSLGVLGSIAAVALFRRSRHRPGLGLASGSTSAA